MINMLKKLTFYFNFLVKLLRTLVSPYFQLHREVSFFTGRGDQVLFIRSKGRIKRFFQIKKGDDHLYFLKK